jgi:spermidine synthase
MKALQSTKEKLHVGVVGLGIGGSVCYARPGDSWTLYEIDPLVVHIAKDSGHFSYLNKCVPTARIQVGDARISLTREPDGIYDVLILDAYTSDSIPMHLVTREAMALVRAKLAPGGVVLFNISNRYLKLEPVVARAAEAAGLVGIAQFYPGTPKKDHEPADASQWLVLAADPADLNAVAASGHWRQLKPEYNTPLWTDDFSNLVGVVSFRLR